MEEELIHTFISRLHGQVHFDYDRGPGSAYFHSPFKLPELLSEYAIRRLDMRENQSENPSVNMLKWDRRTSFKIFPESYVGTGSIRSADRHLYSLLTRDYQLNWHAYKKTDVDSCYIVACIDTHTIMDDGSMGFIHLVFQSDCLLFPADGCLRLIAFFFGQGSSQLNRLTGGCDDPWSMTYDKANAKYIESQSASEPKEGDDYWSMYDRQESDEEIVRSDNNETADDSEQNYYDRYDQVDTAIKGDGHDNDEDAEKRLIVSGIDHTLQGLYTMSRANGISLDQFKQMVMQSIDQM